MRAVGLKTLKNRLNEYCGWPPGARLSPPRAGRAETLAYAMLAEAVRRGVGDAAGACRRGAPPRKPVTAFGALMEELRQDREDR